jgi:hypothetical protein
MKTLKRVFEGTTMETLKRVFEGRYTLLLV